MRLRTVAKLIRKDAIILRTSLMVSALYGVLYYLGTGYIQINNATGLRVTVVTNWSEMIWRTRGPFLWEPIMSIDLFRLGVLISVPNLLFGFLLVLLVFGNLSIVLLSIRHPTVCTVNTMAKGRTLTALIPALFTGFGCCAPTVIILWVSLFGSVSSLMVIAFRWLMPLGLFLLTISLIAGYRSIIPVIEKDGLLS